MHSTKFQILQSFLMVNMEYKTVLSDRMQSHSETLKNFHASSIMKNLKCSLCFGCYYSLLISVTLIKKITYTVYHEIFSKMF